MITNRKLADLVLESSIRTERGLREINGKLAKLRDDSADSLAIIVRSQTSDIRRLESTLSELANSLMEIRRDNEIILGHISAKKGQDK